ncbi:MAG TPA: hypothetical protein VFG05_03440 [Methylocella sp.]|nr:hypothetical protein [Methylocella sp.]
MILQAVKETAAAKFAASTITNLAPALIRGRSRALLALAALTFSFNAPAKAETLSISATGLVLRCPCSFDNIDNAEENKGVFVGQKPNGRYFVPVVFPVTAGQKICSFSMVYHDINQADTMTARLFRKTYVVGGNPFNVPVQIAKVSSALPVVNKVRVATTNVINAPAITATNSFYYIEVDIPTFNLNLLGFQIEYKPACP